MNPPATVSKKIHRPRVARAQPHTATARRKKMTPEEFAAAAAKLGPKGQAALEIFSDFEKKHPGYGELAWPRLKAAMERSNGRTRKIFVD